MLDRPTTLSAEDRRMLERRGREVEIRILEALEAILGHVESEQLRDVMSSLAFRTNDALPKRTEPPKLEPALLVTEIYLSFDDDEQTLEQLLRFAVGACEYFDITDDLFDGDVRESYRDRVFVCQQVFVPELVRTARTIDPAAVSFWADRTTRLLESCLAEEAAEVPTLQSYRAILDRQAELFGSVTGMAAIAANASDDAVGNAASIGRTYFEFEQLLLDGEQYAGDEDGVWNAWKLGDPGTVEDLLKRRRMDAHEHLSNLPDERTESLRALFAIDLEEWMATRDLG